MTDTTETDQIPEAPQHPVPFGTGEMKEESSPPQKPPRRTGVLVTVVVSALVSALVTVPVAYRVGKNAAGGSFSIPTTTQTKRTSPDAGSVAAVVEAVRPSVVGVFTQSKGPGTFLQTVPRQGAGSGVVLDGAGHILTNAHVVAGATEIDVVFSEGSRKSATVVGSDETTDIAVLKVAEDGLTPAPLGDSGTLHVGDRVIAVGNALALPGGPTVTEGIVSALDRSIETDTSVYEHLIQTDAAINPGNSGGPLLDEQGRLVGINTAVISDAQNIGFAIAITPAKSIIEQLINNGKIVRPVLGVAMIDVTPAVAAQQGLTVKEGALVAQVFVGSGADRAGIRPGDVIVEIEGKRIANKEDAQAAIRSHKPGDRITLVVVRGDRKIQIGAVIGEK